MGARGGNVEGAVWRTRDCGGGRVGRSGPGVELEAGTPGVGVAGDLVSNPSRIESVRSPGSLKKREPDSR